MQGTRVWYLVRKLRSHVLFGRAKKIYIEREIRREEGREGNIIAKKEKKHCPRCNQPPGSAPVLCLQWVCACQFSPTLHVCACVFSRVPLFVTPWTVAHKAPLSMGFFRQEYWRGLPFPSPGDLPKPGIELMSPALAGRFFATEPLGRPYKILQLGPTSFLLSWVASTQEIFNI